MIGNRFFRGNIFHKFRAAHRRPASLVAQVQTYYHSCINLELFCLRIIDARSREVSVEASSKLEMKNYDKIYINGKWCDSTNSGKLEVINSTTEEVMGRIPEGSAEDANHAVAAAKA